MKKIILILLITISFSCSIKNNKTGASLEDNVKAKVLTFINTLKESDIPAGTIAVTRFDYKKNTYIGISTETWIDNEYPNRRLRILLDDWQYDEKFIDFQSYSNFTCYESIDNYLILYYNYKCDSKTNITDTIPNEFSHLFYKFKENDGSERLEYEFLFKVNQNVLVEMKGR